MQAKLYIYLLSRAVVLVAESLKSPYFSVFVQRVRTSLASAENT